MFISDTDALLKARDLDNLITIIPAIIGYFIVTTSTIFSIVILIFMKKALHNHKSLIEKNEKTAN